MTVDEETKKYIQELLIDQSMKVSALLSSICSMLEEKKVLTRGEFDIIMERARVMHQQIKSLGPVNIVAMSTMVSEIEKLKKELEKGSLEGRKDWKDLK